MGERVVKIGRPEMRFDRRSTWFCGLCRLFGDSGELGIWENMLTELVKGICDAFDSGEEMAGRIATADTAAVAL